MRSLEVYRNGIFAGHLIEENRTQYIFRYDERYYVDDSYAAISLTLPKSQMEYHSEFLFPVFFHLLSEGVNRKLQCNHWKIDEEDHFGILAATAQVDSIGAVTVKPIPEA